MSDKEILDKYIDLEKSCLTDKAKKEVMNMPSYFYLYNVKLASSNSSNLRVSEFYLVLLRF